MHCHPCMHVCTALRMHCHPCMHGCAALQMHYYPCTAVLPFTCTTTHARLCCPSHLHMHYYTYTAVPRSHALPPVHGCAAPRMHCQTYMHGSAAPSHALPSKHARLCRPSHALLPMNGCATHAWLCILSRAQGRRPFLGEFFAEDNDWAILCPTNLHRAYRAYCVHREHFLARITRNSIV